MAFVSLSDDSGKIEMAVFSDVFHECRQLLEKDKLVVIEGDVSVDEYSGGYRLSCRQVFDMTTARETYARRLLVSLNEAQCAEGAIEQLKGILQPYLGGVCPVMIDYHKPDAQVLLKLGPKWAVKPTDELINQLEYAFGEQTVNVKYATEE